MTCVILYTFKLLVKQLTNDKIESSESIVNLQASLLLFL